MVTITKCTSCDLDHFREPAQPDPERMDDWLARLPGVNYQCAIRKNKVSALVAHTRQRHASTVAHCFLAVGCELGCNVPGPREEIARTRDVYICWLLTTGQIYAVDAHNLSELFMKSRGDEQRYATRWIGCNEPRLFLLWISVANSESLIQSLTTPYQFRGDNRVGVDLEIRMKHLADTIQKLSQAPVAIVAPAIVTRASPSKPSIGHRIQAIQIKLEPHRLSDTNGLPRVLPWRDSCNRAQVTIKADKIVVRLAASSLFHITEAYDLRDAITPSGSPIEPSYSSLAKTLTCKCVDLHASAEIIFDLTEMPLLLRELALLRIWAERPQPIAFELASSEYEIPVRLE